MILDLHRQGPVDLGNCPANWASTGRRFAELSFAAWSLSVWTAQAASTTDLSVRCRNLLETGHGLSGPDWPADCGGSCASEVTPVATRPARICFVNCGQCPLPAFEVRFETPPGDQAQVDFAHFQVVLTDEPSVMRIVWLFSFVLGHSRLIWARFVLHQDMQTGSALSHGSLRGDRRRSQGDPLRPHEDGGDRRRRWQHCLQSRAHRFCPALRLPTQGLRPYRAKTKGKVERPYRYIREDFFLARSLPQSR